MNNFTVRTFAGAVYLAVMVAGILFSPIAFGALFIVILAGSLSEFYNITLGGAFPVERKIGVILSAALFMLVFAYCEGWLEKRWISAGIIPLTAMIFSIVMEKDRSGFGSLPYIFMGLVYVALPICLCPLVVFRDGVFDGTLLLSFFILIWISDSGAYCLGTLFGQKPDSRKLAPHISPKKSWWGLWSGIGFCVAAAIGLKTLGWLPYGWGHCAALGVVVSVAGVFGDLFESQWKRFFGIKDSGNVIPGHGGFLDRFDSALVAIPLACAYLSLTGLL